MICLMTPKIGFSSGNYERKMSMLLYKDNCAGVDDCIYNVVHQQCEKLLGSIYIYW